MKGYDDLPMNSDILLDLPFYEGTGTITHDVAKPHHILTQHAPGGGSFTWGNLVTGHPYLEFITAGGGATDGVYLDCPTADTVDLDFIAGDYSIGGWINWTNVAASSLIAGRYELDVDGWEIYLYGGGADDILTVRHHHAAGATLRTACYSVGWTPSTWLQWGISRSGVSTSHYRNGVSLNVTCSTGGLINPETCNQDLVIGARYTKDADWYKGMMSRPRIWDRALSASDWMEIFEIERDWYGV